MVYWNHNSAPGYHHHRSAVHPSSASPCSLCAALHRSHFSPACWHLVSDPLFVSQEYSIDICARTLPKVSPNLAEQASRPASHAAIAHTAANSNLQRSPRSQSQNASAGTTHPTLPPAAPDVQPAQMPSQAEMQGQPPEQQREAVIIFDCQLFLVFSQRLVCVQHCIRFAVFYVFSQKLGAVSQMKDCSTITCLRCLCFFSAMTKCMHRPRMYLKDEIRTFCGTLDHFR